MARKKSGGKGETAKPVQTVTPEKSKKPQVEISAKRLVDVMHESNGYGEKFCFILGAGASVAAGIPSGLTLAKQWRKEIKDTFSEGDLKNALKQYKLEEKDIEPNSENYFNIYDVRFYPQYNNGYKFLQKMMEGKEPSYGHHPLAAQLAEGANNLAITTNFDTLIEDALFIYTDNKPIIADHESLAEFIEIQQKRPIIAKIHRGLFYKPQNRKKELNAGLAASWKKVLKEAFKYYTPVVIGYSGGDNTLMDILKSPELEMDSIYWCYRRVGNTQTAKELVSEEIFDLVTEKKGVFVPIGGFDEIMLLLGQRYGVKDPTDQLTKIASRRGESYKEQKENLMKKLKEEGQKETMEQSVEIQSEGLEKNPMNAWAYFSRGSTYYFQGEYDKALGDLNKAIELEPTRAIYYNYRGAVYKKLGEYGKALADFNKAIELEPDDAGYYYFRGTTYDELGETGKALEDYNKAVELEPDNAVYYYFRGRFYDKLGEQDKALKDASKAIELNPSKASYYYFRGTTYDKLGERDKALEDFNKAIELEPTNSEYYSERGLTFVRLGKLDEARKDIDKALDLDDKNDTVYYCDGLLHFELGEYEKAVSLVKKAIAIWDEWYGYHYLLASAYHMLDKHKEEKAAVEKAKEQVKPNQILVSEGYKTYQKIKGCFL